jgi:hypothetical protein
MASRADNKRTIGPAGNRARANRPRSGSRLRARSGERREGRKRQKEKKENDMAYAKEAERLTLGQDGLWMVRDFIIAAQDGTLGETMEWWSTCQNYLYPAALDWWKAFGHHFTLLIMKIRNPKIEQEIERLTIEKADLAEIWVDAMSLSARSEEDAKDDFPDNLV